MKIVVSSKSKFIFIFIWIILVCISMLTAYNYKTVISKRNYKLLDETPIGYYLSDYEKDNNTFKKQGISQYKVYENSDLVVKVTTSKNRQFKYDSLLTTVKVEDVYKGNHGLTGQDIYVYEWATIGLFENHLVYQSKDGYNAMNTGDQYYLFLKFNQMPDQYKYSDKDLRTYLLTNIYNSKFNCTVCNGMTLLPGNENYNRKTYGDIKAWDILPIKQGQLQLYFDNRKKVLDLLH